jgi:hypothetical protein
VRAYRRVPENRTRANERKRIERRNAGVLCVCGNPVGRTGVRRVWFCSQSCKAACTREAVGRMAAALASAGVAL